MHRFAFAAAAAFLLATLTPDSSSAFCRTWSCKVDATNPSCPPDPGNPQCAGGDPEKHHALYWPQQCIGFSLNIGPVGSTASKKLDTDYVRAQAKFSRIVDLSFATWQKADCGAGQHPSLTFFDLGFSDCNKREFNDYQPDEEVAQGNANLIVLHDKWPYNPSDTTTLALTTLTFSQNSGEIYDADIDVNGAVALTTSDANPQFDLQSVLTHEIGHFLGLADSRVEGSTMFSPPASGSISQRGLAGDDVAAICAVYPTVRSGLPQCDPTPRHGLGTTCGIEADVPSSDGCSTVAPAQRSARSPWAVLGALTAVAGAVVARGRRGGRQSR